jgi:ABC-type multidrug transport system ATPase subunit
MIVLEGVCFGYSRGREILSGIDIEFGSGLSLLVGPNGCGKSTLLKIVAGVEMPWRGNVTVEGHDLWRSEVAARSHLAYLPEHPDLTPYATVSEILCLVCGLRGEPAAASRNALEWVGLEDLGDRTVRELSKGQRRRATLAAARIGSPGYLLLDEPLEGMDRGIRREIVRWVQRRIDAGGSAVVVSHEFEVFADLASRGVTVRDGRCRVVEPLPSSGPDRIALLDGLAVGDDAAEGRSR